MYACVHFALNEKAGDDAMHHSMRWSSDVHYAGRRMHERMNA